MAETKVSDLASIIQVIVSDVQYTARNEPVMRQLVWVMDLPEHKGEPIDVPKLGKLTAQSLTEGIDLASPQTLTDTDISISPGEVGLQVILTDRMLSRAPAGFFNMVADECGRAYAEKLDTDLLSLLDGFSISTPGTGVVLQLPDLSNARAYVRGNPTEPGPEPLYCVLHPFQLNSIVNELVPVTAVAAMPPNISEEVLRDYFKGKTRPFGMPVFEDGNITVDGSDDAKGGVFSKKAIILIVTQEALPKTQRDESLRAEEVNLIGEYGYAEWQDSFGVEIYSQAKYTT